jgi:hypothetical protein
LGLLATMACRFQVTVEMGVSIKVERQPLGLAMPDLNGSQHAGTENVVPQEESVRSTLIDRPDSPGPQTTSSAAQRPICNAYGGPDARRHA